MPFGTTLHSSVLGVSFLRNKMIYDVREVIGNLTTLSLLAWSYGL
jgi:hypothetical protein